ncbi:MAG: acetylornithine aminotransferase [Candidatus Rokubacteria bacterium GWC2_70_16]|nr:MAG: acetylornithine aminotransferase [Candidatus Rokubacteria bacterium GWC2_70_16]OGL16959.1 MAG: acetylornithine aminotransferase [Candidatus Rokubacteria bacterium RIFCSPLOWO2_12_FULL_71_19]
MDTKQLLEWSDKHLMTFAKRYPVALVRGEGVRVWDTDGKEYLDFTGGIAVTALGHSHPRVVGTMREQATALLHVSNYFHIPQQIHLAKLLCDHSFADRVFFSNSGAEANETAIKLCRKWAKEHGGSDRGDIISMRGGFHGRTLATVTATAQEKYHHGYEPLPGGFKYVPFNDLKALERAIDSRTAGVLVEPIQGEGGVNIPDDGYLPGLRKLCDEAGIALILDEIQTGMGRTGRLWCHEHAGIAPDIMTLAKALANGVPIGATLATEEVARVFTPGSHGTTFGGNPLATAVGLTVLGTLLEERLPERAARLGRFLLERLEALRAGQPEMIKAVRGRGLLVGVDLTPPVGDVVAACRERGLLVLTAGENTLRMAPPLIVTEADAARAVDIVGEALGALRR